MAGDDAAVLRSSALMASGTVLSRLTGVLRDISIAAALGFGMLADTYALGNSLPNIVYILVIGGALNAVFVPQLVRHLHEDEDGGDEYAHRLLTVTGLALIALSVTAVLLAPWIVRLYATGSYGPAELDLATAFARYCLPQIFCYGLYTMLSQVLNSRMVFGPPMFAPIINNVVMITAALGFVWLVGTGLTVGTITPAQTAVLGITTTAGIAAQAFILIPFMRRAGYRFKPRFGFRGHGLGKAGSLAGWTIGLVLVNQVGFLIVSRLATAANVLASEAGTIAAGLATYQRAYLVFVLPHSVITISLVTALLPRMSRSAAQGDLADVSGDVSSGVRTLGALIIPTALFLVAFGPALGTILFDFGAGRGPAATYTGVVVSAFAMGLVPFSIFYVLLRGWYATENTRTPFVMTVAYNVIAIPLTIACFSIAPLQWKVVSLAVAYAAAYWIVAAIAWSRLSVRLGGLHTRPTARALARVVAAALPATALAFGVSILVNRLTFGTAEPDSPGWFAPGYWSAIMALGIGAVVLIPAYGLLARAFRISEVGDVVALLARRRAQRPDPGPHRDS